MAELLLIVSLLAVFVFGFYLVRSTAFRKRTEQSILSFPTEKKMSISLR